MQKRLAIFLPTLDGGGAERVMLNLAIGLARESCAVDLVLPRAEGAYLAEIPETVRLVALRRRRLRSYSTLASLPHLVHYLRREQPDAMITALHANFVALWGRRLAEVPTRLVISQHSVFSSTRQQGTAWRPQLLPHLARHYYPWADGIVAVSGWVADDLAQALGIPRARIRVIYNPVVTPQLRAKAEAPLTHRWFQPKEPPVVLAVGSLSAVKDFALLIRAFAVVRQSRPVRLLILGEGQERLTLEALVREFGLEQDVSLPGFVTNPYPCMVHAKALVLSSRSEALPSVLIEALYCGAPVIATDCPGGTREILQDGKYGQLVPAGDVHALAKSIEAALDRPPSCPPSAAWKPFELEAVVGQYREILFGV